MSNNRRAQPGTVTVELVVLYAAIVVILLTLLSVNVAVWAGHQLAGLPAPPADPWEVLAGVIQGRVIWPPESTRLMIAMIVLLLGTSGVVTLVLVRRNRRNSRADGSARYLGKGKDITPLTLAAARKTAARLGVDAPGVPIGRSLNSGEMLWGSWESTHVDVWGPRTGKTTSRAIPAILEAPGAVIVTSNKRDVVDATRDLRMASGTVWVFDPQQIALEGPDRWWWNPLSYVTDEAKAQKLAEHFATGSRDAGAHTDAFFDSSGRDLLAAFLLAAALGKHPITEVYRWLSNPENDTPLDILANSDYELIADQVRGARYAPDRQRAGVYGTAQQMAACLTNRNIARWVTPRAADDSRQAFNPHAFVASRGTLYSLSREGRGTAGPLISALTAAVVEAAEELATRSAGGRLSMPLLAVLDEAANVCRWKDLPDLYSHYGSRGIVLMTILQSWSQGEEVWGESGMRKLWSAANIAVYGGGVKEESFLNFLSQLTGDYDKVTRSVSQGKDQRNVSTQLQRERIFDASDLHSLPMGRAIVFASGARPTMMETIPWMKGPHAAAVMASIKAHDPGNTRLPSSQPTPTETGLLLRGQAV